MWEMQSTPCHRRKCADENTDRASRRRLVYAPSQQCPTEALCPAGATHSLPAFVHQYPCVSLCTNTTRKKWKAGILVSAETPCLAIIRHEIDRARLVSDSSDTVETPCFVVAHDVAKSCLDDWSDTAETPCFVVAHDVAKSCLDVSSDTAEIPCLFVAHTVATTYFTSVITASRAHQRPEQLLRELAQLRYTLCR